jgi:hypothetical protein
LKLFQYRFGADGINRSSQVGDGIKSFFERANDLNLNGIFSTLHDRSSVERKPLEPHKLSQVAARSFQQSYSLKNIRYDYCGSIKSLESCRFAIFEDDGLVRICYASEDEIIGFEQLSPAIADVSSLLIETDLFDFF